MKNTSELFEQFLKKHAPKTAWKKLVRQTRHNSEPIRENIAELNDGWYENGLILIRDGCEDDDHYVFTSRTIENKSEKVNSEAIFSIDNKFLNGVVNMFDFGFIDDSDDGDYHHQLLTELLNKKDFSWDKIE